MSEFEKAVIVLPASVKVVKATRCVLRNLLISNDVNNESLLYDLELVLSEALVNVIEHTYNFDSSKLISCTFKIDDGFLEMRIRDFGPKVELEKLKPRSLSQPREGGLGLYLIRNLVDSWEYEDVCNGNSLILRRKIK
ncbi:ATP-binding protein [Mesoaciditoga sp.]